MGFNLGLTTFDRWQSFDIQQELKAVGIKTETLSVAKKHYEDLAMLIYEERIAMPHIDLLFEEMSELKIVSDKKVDHPRKKSKDLADAMCGSVYNAISHTPRLINQEIEVHTWKSASRASMEKEKLDNVIYPPAPKDVEEYLMNMNML